MCRCVGKTAFLLFNLALGILGIALLLLVGYCISDRGNRFEYAFDLSTLGFGLLLMFMSFFLCAKGFRNKCFLGFYLGFLVLLFFAELVIVGISTKHIDYLTNGLPPTVKEFLVHHVIDEQMVLLLFAGCEAVVFFVGLGIYKQPTRRQGRNSSRPNSRPASRQPTSRRLLGSRGERSYGSYTPVQALDEVLIQNEASGHHSATAPPPEYHDMPVAFGEVVE